MIVAALVFGLDLLKVPKGVIVWTALVMGVLGLLGGFIPASWIFPSLEVTTGGQTRLWRVLKYVGPIVAGLIVTGIAKKLYG
jgi:hypothetical protein